MILRAKLAALLLSSCALAVGPVQAAPALPSADVRAAAPTTPTSSVRKDARPNVILILADDLGVEGLNVYGGEYHTPNLDRLAAEGIRFENAHATPICTTSRTRIMTGQENHRNYEAFAYLAPNQYTFGNLLKDAGYATGIIGKWQLSGNGFDGRKGITPEQAGFDESQLWQRYPLDARGSRYWGPTRVINGRTVIKEEGFGPDVDLAFALDFIDRHAAEPFFLYLPMALVHDPFVATPTSPASKDPKARWASMITYMDSQVGQLLDHLKTRGIDGDTVIIFLGDNGTNRKITSTRNGHKVPGGKGLPTLNGTHVPLIVRAPRRIGAGQVSEALFDFTDVVPTVAELTGASLEGHTIDGRSQVPVLTGKASSVRENIFMHYAPVWQMTPARFAFDTRFKLYGDGRFVSLDPASGTETPVAPSARKGEAARHYQALRKVLDSANDGPLNPERYPQCVGKLSRDPAQPATVAGCASVGEDG